MTETDRIKSALVNVITLANHSDYYNKDRDDQDIDLIAKIVKKEIPIKPIVDGHELICGCCHEPMNIGFCFCHNRGKGHYIVRTDNHSNYCNNCGKRIDWSDEE